MQILKKLSQDEIDEADFSYASIFTKKKKINLF